MTARTEGGTSAEGRVSPRSSTPRGESTRPTRIPTRSPIPGRTFGIDPSKTRGGRLRQLDHPDQGILPGKADRAVAGYSNPNFFISGPQRGSPCSERNVDSTLKLAVPESRSAIARSSQAKAASVSPRDA